MISLFERVNKAFGREKKPKEIELEHAKRYFTALLEKVNFTRGKILKVDKFSMNDLLILVESALEGEGDLKTIKRFELSRLTGGFRKNTEMQELRKYYSLIKTTFSPEK